MFEQNKSPRINTQDLEALVSEITENRTMGEAVFRLHSESIGGVAAKTHTGTLTRGNQNDSSRDGKFTLETDEPTVLLGADAAMSPNDYILQALAGCYTVTITALATARNIQLDSIKLSLGFDIDLAGFLGIDPDVRNGAQQITIDIELESQDATKAQLEEIVSALPSASPIHDTLAQPVKVVPKLV